MSTEQPPKLGYATRLPNDARAIPWTLAILSWLLLFTPWPAQVLITHSPTLAYSLRGALLVNSLTIAGGAGSIACGVLGTLCDQIRSESRALGGACGIAFRNRDVYRSISGVDWVCGG